MAENTIRKERIYMAVQCGWASIGETGNGRNNKAGDQTGREVKVGEWYQFGQKAVYRWKSRSNASRYARIIKTLCKNDNIGYDMNDRTTLYNLLAKNGWDYTKVNRKVECDCSQLVACAINCTMGKAICSSGMWTGNINSQLMNSGLFDKLTDSKYLTSGTYLKVGDIINAPDHHVISCLQNGSGATKTKLTIDGWWGNETTKATQKFFGTKVDGYVSNQPRKYKKFLPRASEAAWQFKRIGYKGGSLMVISMQKWLKVKANGYMGTATVKALQKKLGIKETGKLDIDTVKAWQRYLNKKK